MYLFLFALLSLCFVFLHCIVSAVMSLFFSFALVVMIRFLGRETVKKHIEIITSVVCVVGKVCDMIRVVLPG